MGFGEQCTGCGKCCTATPCAIGLALLGDYRPCRALEYKNGKYYCGLVLHASQYVDLGEYVEWKDEFLAKLFSHMLGIGAGCCSSPSVDLHYYEFLKKMKGRKKLSFVDAVVKIADEMNEQHTVEAFEKGGHDGNV